MVVGEDFSAVVEVVASQRSKISRTSLMKKVNQKGAGSFTRSQTIVCLSVKADLEVGHQERTNNQWATILNLVNLNRHSKIDSWPS